MKNLSLRTISLFVGGLIGICIVGAAILFGVTTFATRGIATSGEAFMEALQREDFARAYDMMDPALVEQVGRPIDFESGLTGNGVIPETWRFTSRSIENGEGRLEGSLSFKDGRDGEVILVLTQHNGEWVIRAFSLRPVTAG